MRNTLITSTYFPSIAHYVAIQQGADIALEYNENYQKQTYRNSCFINTANGKKALTVPVIYSQKNGHILTKDIKIADIDNWQKQHLKALKTAYNSSPFFEFYIDDLLPIFTKKHTFLFDLNELVFTLINDALMLDKAILKTSSYEITPSNALDYRFLANRRKEKTYAFSKYTQVFGTDFISNLSILDLLFMEGPSASIYLEKQVSNSQLAVISQ